MTFPYFIDIETVPLVGDWNELDERTSEIYHKRFRTPINDLWEYGSAEPHVEHWADNAAIYAEFGKIVCVCIGVVAGDQLRIKKIVPGGPGAEARLLAEVGQLIDKTAVLAGHNVKEFDIPFIQRRMLIHGIAFPLCLQTMGKKPWDILHEDTMEMWGFGSYRHKMSLEALANCFGLPSPKSDMNGSMVREVYYEPTPTDVLPFDHEKKCLDRIANYCAGDIGTTANVYCKIKRQPIFSNIVIVN